MRFQFDTRAFIVVVVLVLALGAACSAIFWGDLSATENGKSESLSTTVRNVMLILAAILALPLAIWRGWVAEQQVKATQDSVDVAHMAISNQRFQAAAAMLGNSHHPVVIGAIQTLDRLARESPENYYRDTMILLTEFVRHPPSRQRQRGSGSRSAGFDWGPTTVTLVSEAVPLAIQIIGTREVRHDELLEERLSMASADMSKLSLGGLDFTDLVLRDALLTSTNLEGTDFSGSDLSYCRFHGTNLRGAIFSGANLSGTVLSSVDVERDGSYVDGDSVREDAIEGLTQRQLDEAWADDENPPRLRGSVDSETGEPLRWRNELT